MEPRLDIIGAALADPSRKRILCELMDGRAFTGKELACAAEIAPSTASAHLSKLVASGLVSAMNNGRHTYHRIASEEVAEALESLSRLSPTDHLKRARRSVPDDPDAFAARTCYNHIAGRLGVLLTRRLLEEGAISRNQDGGFSPGPDGNRVFKKLEIDIPEPPSGKPVVRPCMDWTERRDHMTGPLANTILQRFLEAGWVQRKTGTRALIITTAGYQILSNVLNISKDNLAEPT